MTRSECYAVLTVICFRSWMSQNGHDVNYVCFGFVLRFKSIHFPWHFRSMLEVSENQLFLLILRILIGFLPCVSWIIRSDFLYSIKNRYIIVDCFVVSFNRKKIERGDAKKSWQRSPREKRREWWDLLVGFCWCRHPLIQRNRDLFFGGGVV